MELTIQVNPYERTVRFREVSSLAAGDVCSVTLDGIRGADVPSLRMALYRDAVSESPVASCPSFSAVPGHSGLVAGGLRLDTVEMAAWFESARPSEESSDDGRDVSIEALRTGPGRPEDDAERAVRTDGWLVVSDSARTWAACRVPVILRPVAGTSGAVDPMSLAALVGGLVSAAMSGSMAGKADKAVPSSTGNLASLSTDGNLVDSLKSPSDFAPATHVSDASVHHTAADIGQIAATKVAEVVAGAPDNLDTLKEIADVIGTEAGQAAGGILKRVADLETGKASKSEMSVTPGTGADADKTTIQLKDGTSATVLAAHQDISGKMDVAAAYPEWDHSISYEYPDIVSYGGRLWRAISGPNGYPGLYDGEWEEVFLKDLKRGMDDLAYCADDWFVTGGTISRLLLRKVADGQWAGTQDGVQWGLMRIAGEWYFGKTADTSYGGRSDASADATSLSIDIGGTAYLLTKGDRLALVSEIGEIDISGKLDGSAAYPAWEQSDYQPPAIVSHKGRLWRCQNYTIAEPGEEPKSDWVEVTIENLKQNALTVAQMDAANSGVTAEKAAAWDGYAVQIAQKANATDLPYAMATISTPTVWLFGGSGVQSGHVYSVVETEEDGYWTYSLKDNGSQISYFEAEGQLTTLDFSEAGSPLIDIVATLAGYALLDRANNLIDASTGNVTLTLPAYQEGKVRDLLVACTIGLDGNDELWSVIFQGADGEEISFKAEGDDAASATFPVPDAAGDWWYSLTERAPHVFAVSLKQLQSVSQPTQTQGGS